MVQWRGCIAHVLPGKGLIYVYDKLQNYGFDFLFLFKFEINL